MGRRQDPSVLPLILVVFVVFATTVRGCDSAGAALPRGAAAVKAAALLAWCGSSNRVCAEGVKAYSVSGCETGGTYDRWASNGQYLGLWQMGKHERATCGEVWGRDPWTQARAAHCWWSKVGWGAWACA